MDAKGLKTKEFTHKCVKLPINLPYTELEPHTRRQLIRCSASLSVNYPTTILAQTKTVLMKIYQQSLIENLISL